MQIFPATIDQLEDVALLFDQYRVCYLQDSSLTGAREFIADRLIQRDSVILLATKSNSPLGYTQLFPSWSSVSMKRVWILNDLFVLPQVRNQGVAKALQQRISC